MLRKQKKSTGGSGAKVAAELVVKGDVVSELGLSGKGDGKRCRKGIGYVLNSSFKQGVSLQMLRCADDCGA